MKTEILPYKRMENTANSSAVLKSRSFFNSFLSKTNLVLFPTAFLLGKATLMGSLMPFGMPFYASTYGLNVNRLLVAAVIILGMIAGGAKEQLYISVAAMLLFNVFNISFRKSKQKPGLRFAITGFFSIMIPEMVVVYLQGFLLYDLLKALFHGFIVFTLTLVFRNFISIIDSSKGLRVFSNEELISVSIVMALALSGFAGIQILGFTIKNIMCVLVILLAAFKYGPGVGAASGVTVGLVVSMSDTATPLIIGSYALCGLLAGLFKSIGKAGAGLGFVMGNTVLILYLNGSVQALVQLKEILLAVVVFMLTPQSFIEAVTGAFRKNISSCSDKQSYSQRIREITIERLNKFSRTFKELSKTLSEIAQTKVVTDKQDISFLFDRVADKVCKDCSLCLHCWDRNFYNTYQVMFKIIEKIDKKGRIDENDIPEYFMERCERIREFVEAVNNIFEIFKVDMVWKSKMGEGRALVSQQLEGLSNAISGLAAEIGTDIHFKSDFEDSILQELCKEGIKASDIIVFENKWGKYEIDIFHKGCGGRRSCVSTIERVVMRVVGRKMVKEDTDCHQNARNGLCILKLLEEEPFKVTTGIARAAKHDFSVSGDSYSFMSTGDGKYIVALSDGMGSGNRAANQSRAAISLLEQFMESGFDKDTAIKLINSILVLKSSDDSFATIDLSVIDLFSGEAEFVKVGAVTTFIKREDRVESIKSVTLPAGILSNIETELIHKKLDKGGFIVMVSDGVLDSFKSGEEEGEKAAVRLLLDSSSTNPQEIADTILDEAYRRSDDKPADDMTVIVAKIWKRAA
jgi:stage II sporulation protein E